MTWPAFANPWILAGLVAVGLPILIHLLTRARPRRVSFPPFKFLVEACAGQQAVHRLRTILLLSLRTLAVLALVLLFTRPFLKPSGTATHTQATRRIVLILDASFSMRAVQQGVPLFARGQAEAAGVLRGLESGSEAAVVLSAATPRLLLPALSRNLPALHEELVKAQPTFEQGNPAAALALAGKLLGGVGTIYIFSDFQKSNWDTVGELPGGTVCRLRPVTREPIDNVALSAIQAVPAEPIAGEPAEVICTVFNGTPRPRQERVRLELGGITQEMPVTVPAFSSADAVFPITCSQPGPLTGRATTTPDDLREDNVRHLTLRVSKALQALLISDAEASDARSAAYFVARALAPSEEAAPGLKIIRRHSQDADRGILETADLFVLVAPAALTGETVEIIARRVREGGRCMAFLDGPTAPQLAPASFSPPFQLQRSVISESGERLLPGPRRLFSDGDANDFNALRFFRHYQNQVLPGRASEVLLTYADGSAALTLSPVGQGAAVFVNFPLTPDSGDFIGHPLFPATLHELLRALRRGAEEHAATPGTAWTLDVPTVGEIPLAVSDPEGRPVSAPVLSSGRTTKLAMPKAAEPGAYLVKQGDHLAAAAVVNLDPRESDTRPIALENLKSGPGTLVSVAHEESDLLLADKTRPLWPQLAATAALLLALEMVLLALWRRRPVQTGLIPPARPDANMSSGAAGEWTEPRIVESVK